MGTWWQVVAALAGGGAMGAILTASITSFKNRVQPVLYTVRVELLSPTRPGISLNFRDEFGTYWQYPNLYEITVSLRNQANKDWAQFSFGLTLQRSHKAIFGSVETPDRHHQLISAAAVSPTSELDYTSTPFNRGDEYTVELFVVAHGGNPLTEGDIQLSSAEAVRFSRTHHL
jgi:hypothetical protein